MDGLNTLGVQIDPREQALRKLYDEARRLGVLSQRAELRMFESLLREFDSDLFVVLRERVERAQRLDFLCPRPLDKHLPLPDEAAGEIRIGTVVGGGEYGISSSERHIGVFGTTGAGKSVLNRMLMKHFIRSGRPCVIFSKKRGDAHSIASLFPDRVVVFRLADKDFRYNPLEGGPGITLTQAHSDFTESFCQAMRLMEASSEYTLWCISQLIERLGTHDHPERLPGILELYRLVAGMKHLPTGREAQYHQAVHTRLRGMLSFLGEVFYCSKGFPIEQALLDGWSIVLETDGIKEEIALFVTINITLRLFSWMLNPDALKPVGGICLFLDDSQEIFNINLERRREESLPLMPMMAARFRQAGILIASVQVPSLTSLLLRQNLGTTIILVTAGGPFSYIGGWSHRAMK